MGGLMAIGLAGALAAPAEAPRPRQILSFDRAPVGALTVARLAEISPAPLLWAEGLADGTHPGRTRVVVAADGAHALEVDYPAGGVGPQATGAQWMMELSPRDEYSLEYRLRFAADFDWVRGGKLPGLAGGRTPSGGHYDPDGFTARYMWRPNGRLVLYLYWAGQASSRQREGAQYAEDLDTGRTLERGREYVLRQYVRLNRPGQPDGVVRVWLDDELVLERTDLKFRVAADRTWQIDRWFFSTFHGGNDPSWAPRRDVSAQFRDFVVW
jgi:hypothetical protein